MTDGLPPARRTDDPGDLLERVAPELAGSKLSELGDGWDNTAHAVGDDLVLRVSKEPDVDRRGEMVRREAGLLRVLARARLCTMVPEVVRAGPDEGVLLLRRVPGNEARGLLRGPEEPDHAPWVPALITDLVAFLVRLHDVDPREAAGYTLAAVGPSEWLRRTRADVAGLLPVVASEHPEAGKIAEAFLREPGPAEEGPRVLCHNDLDLRHVLVDPRTRRLSGVIDFGDATIGSPARDLALLLEDLGGRALAPLLEGYAAAGGRVTDATTDLARWFVRRATVEDMGYRVRAGDPVGLARTAATLLDLE